MMRLYNRCRLRGKYLEIKMLKMEIFLKKSQKFCKILKILKKTKIIITD